MAKILMVDDAKELLIFLSGLLTMKGHEVRTASSKNEMNSQLALFIPDCILLDVWLNDEDSRKLCKEIKATDLCRNIPVILLSSDPELLKDHEQCGADDILEKPFDINNVIAKINQLLVSNMQR